MAAGNPKQRVGMMYPIWAPLQSHTEGSMPTYGTGIRLMEARTATVTFERNGTPTMATTGLWRRTTARAA